jgi:hypothetical protein
VLGDAGDAPGHAALRVGAMARAIFVGRQRRRALWLLQGSRGTDNLITCCCMCCALIQEVRELGVRTDFKVPLTSVKGEQSCAAGGRQSHLGRRRAITAPVSSRRWAPSTTGGARPLAPDPQGFL